MNDIEVGLKNWESLDKSIDQTCWSYARECVCPTYESENFNCPSDNDLKLCTSWNRFRKSGCQFEYLNPGKVCKYIHECSICSMPHKSWQCSDYNEISENYNLSSSDSQSETESSY